MTRRLDLVERLHGREVADPYRWLEDSEAPEVRAWVEAQNHRFRAAMDALPLRRELQAKLERLLAIGEESLPAVRRRPDGGLRYFHTRRAGHQNQPELLVRDDLDGDDRSLIDPNRLSADGTTSLDWYQPSSDGGLVAYGLSEGGSEESTLCIRNVETGEDLTDRISRARYSSVSWLPGGERFFYSRFPAKGSVPDGEEKYHRTIFEHRIGRDPELDPVAFQAKVFTDFPSSAISPDGRWLVVRVHQGWSKSSLFVADTQAETLRFREITPDLDHIYDPVPLDDALWVRSNEGAPRYALFAVDWEKPERAHWRCVLREHPTDVLTDVALVGGELLASYTRDVVSRLERFDTRGASKGEVRLPTLGNSNGFSGLHDDHQAFFDFESFVTPPSVRRIDLRTGEVRIWKQVQADIATDEFSVTSRKAKSKDGTLIPYLMVHRKDIALDSGDNPTLLYGYGGFNVSLLPRFSRSTYAFLERGGVSVQANLRGGGEFGEEWHRAGQLEKKQNVFDDFIAVAEDLVQTRVTRPERLAIHGRSNGGLLVAATLVQRPDLFRAAVAGVPLTDMLRYHHFQIAKLWIPEYGSPEDPREFEWLFAYSPYHHVEPGTRYGAVLLMTAESDTRVDPMHARKMAAALEHAGAPHPVYLRTESRAGHGAGKPVSKVAEEYADLFAFVLTEIGSGSGADRIE
ncbi:MAG: prolyl oligopeptidase family serine peptidase [Polyangiaceae bacterium]